MDGDRDGIERQLQLMQRLMHARGRGGGAEGNDLAQAMAMLTRGFGGGGGGGGGSEAGPRGRARQAMAAILKQIANNMDESEQYAGLLELCNQLNMATEDTLAAIRPDAFVGPIAACLDKEHNPELMLLAARCLTYMVDAIPVTAVILSSTNAVQILLNRLRVVVDVELSEQCLTCVDKIAQEAAGSILSNDGISAILGFVDFFSLSVQRRAWGTVASLCRRLKFEQWSQLGPALPQIRQAIVHEDQKICECAVLSLYRIVQAMHRDPERVADVFHDAGVAVAEIVARGACDGLFQAALQLTLAAVTYAPAVAAGLIEVGFVGHLMALLESSASTTNAGATDQLSTPASRMSSSPQASPLANTAQIGSPPTSTPPRSSAGKFAETLGGSSSNRKKSLTPEMTKDACATLAALLPTITEGHMQYLNVLAALQASGQFSHLAQNRSDSNLADAMEMEARVPSDLPGDGEEGEEEADEEDEELGGLRAELEDLMMEQWVDIENDAARNARCRPGRHNCNICGASALAQNNWFRCNQCPDVDVCLSCLVHHAGEHTAETEPPRPTAGGRGGRGGSGAAATPARHSFTDMSEIQLRDPTLEATRRLINEAQGASPVTSNARIKSFNEAPYLLQRVAEALPSVIRLRLDTEHPRVQYYSLLFIARAVSFTLADDLRRILVDAPLCEAIVTALGERDLVSQVCGIYIAKELMKKLPDVYSALFAREGVTNALLRIKASCNHAAANMGSPPDSKRASARSSPLLRDDTAKQGIVRLQEQCTTAAGWQAITATEAGELLNMFPSLADASRSAEWEGVCALLREQRYSAAFAQLNELMSDASTFEVMNCSLFQDLRAGFQNAEIPVATVVDFVYTLSGGSGDTATLVAETESVGQSSSGNCSNFTKFIRLLQSSLSQLENFKPMKFAPGLGVSSQIRLNIVPHNREEYTAEVQKRRTRRQLHHSDSGSLPTSPISPHAPMPTPGSEGRSAQVSIEPLASISGVADFVKGNLLPASRRGQSRSAAEGGSGGGDEDVVEDVLPPASPGSPNAAQRGARQPSPASPTNAAQPAVYIRFGRHALSPTWSMLQVIQRYGRNRMGSDGSQGSSSRSSGEQRHRMLRDVPAELRALMEGPEVITLHYSTVPFGPDVRPSDTCHPPHRAGSGGSPDDPITFLPIGDSVITEGCTNIKHSIFQTFEQSKRFLTPLMMHVLSLLGVFYNTIVFWDCVSLWLRFVGRSIVGLSSPTTNVLEFVNAKLNNKAMRHSANLLLAGQHLATWPVNLAMDCNFLFTTQTRRFLFDVSFFGTARSLVRIQEYLQETGNSTADALDASARRQHRLQRIKKRVWRDRPLECATEVLNGQRGIGNSMLEFEFYGEEGSGLGPTLEFYTLVGDAFRERKHQLWRVNDEEPSDKYFNPVNGLFPRALPRGHPELARMSKLFRVIGRYLARALLDKRIPNLRLSRPLVKIIRGDIVSVDQLQNINEGIFKVMRELFLMCRSSSPSGDGCTHVQAVASRVNSLGLTFVMPGVDEIELVPGGAEIPVTHENAVEYINRVNEFLLKTGIEQLVVELRAGFHELVPLYALKILTIEELQALMDGHKAPSTLEELETYCSADHGFSMSSQPVRWLLETIAEMEPSQQQRFFQFLTGSPYLPVGGLSCLRPRLTIVRKTTTDPNVCEAQQLPSAMTCQNYLKLPAYESKEVLKQKLYQAIEEGCGVFLFT